MDILKCIKDEDDKILVQKNDINGGWKNYFYNLFNERYVILLNANMLDIREDSQNYTFDRQVQESTRGKWNTENDV